MRGNCQQFRQQEKYPVLFSESCNSYSIGYGSDLILISHGNYENARKMKF